MLDLIRLQGLFNEEEMNTAGGEVTETTEETQEETTQAEPEEKMVPASEVSRIAAREAKKAAKKAKEELEAEYKKQSMDELELLRTEKAEADQKLLDMQTKYQAAQSLAELAPKVSDAEYALFKANQNKEKYFDEGKLDIEALLNDFPKLKKPDPIKGPAATTSGGGTEKPSQDANGIFINAIKQATGR